MIAAAVTFAGIVAPSLLVIVAIRRWIAPVPWRIASLLLFFTLAFLHGAVFSSRLPVPLDEVARGYPFRGVTSEVRSRNPLTNDTVKLFLPWMQVAREELLQGRAPLWNPYSFSGYPLLGNGESAPFSPLFLVTLFVPLPKQIVAMAGLKIFLALLFGYLFLKREKVSDAAACFGAVAFAFSVYQTTVLYYSAASVSALLPAALFAILHAMDEGSKRSIVLVAIIVATLLANGHPESVLHIAIGAALAVVIDVALSPAERDRLFRLGYPVVGALAGAMLSAPAWVPTLEMIPLSARYAALHAAPPMAPLPLTALWALVAPNGFGNPLRHNWNWISNYTIVAVSYIGLAALALVIAAIISRGTGARARCWVALAVILFLVAMDWSVLGHAINALPLFSIAANDKLRFVAGFFAIAAAATAVERVSRLEYLAAALPLAGLAVYVFGRHRMVMRPIDLLPVLLLFALAPLLRTRWSAAAALTVTAVELFVLNAGFNALVPARYFRPELPIIQALRSRAPAEPFRVAGFDWTFLPNASAQYGLEDIRGSDPMALESYLEYLRPLMTRDQTTDLDRLTIVNDPVTGGETRLDFLGLRFLMAAPGASFESPWKLVYSGSDGTLFENEHSFGRFFGFGPEVTTTQAGAGRYLVDVMTKRPAEVVSSVPAAPGWRALRAGRRLEIDPRHGWSIGVHRKGLIDLEDDHGAFVAFKVPAGASHIEVVYHPASFYLSLYATATALILLSVFRVGNRVQTPQVMPGPCTGPDL
jgi:hypothetical protein